MNNKVKVFLIELHRSKGTGKLANEIAIEVGLSQDIFDKLIEESWIQPTSFGLPDYSIAYPLLKELGLKPHR